MSDKFITSVLLFLVSGFLTMSIYAVPPTNDSFANAQTISGMSGQSIVVNNAEATKEALEQAHALNRGGRSVWYKNVAPGNGSLQISTAASFDTLLAVYEGTNLNDLKLIAANDDIEEQLFSCTCSRLRIGTTSGKTYYIAVDGRYQPNGNISTGDITLNFDLANVSPNDNFANATLLAFASGKLKTTTNVGASKEIGEPNHSGNAGGKSVWFKWIAPAGVPETYDFTLRSVGVTGVNAQALFAIYTGSSVGSLTQVARGSQYIFSKIVFQPIPGTTYYIAIDGIDTGQGSTQMTSTLSYGVFKTDKMPDVDDDGKADLTVFRPTTGTWYSLESTSGNMRSYQWGTNGDKPMVCDYDNDGLIDYTVFRPDTGVWYIKRSTQVSLPVFNWGINTDIPMLQERHSTVSPINDRVPVVFRPSTGTWYINSTGASIQWGLPGDLPMLADFTGDGNDDLTVFRPSTGVWYILTGMTPVTFTAVPFGLNGDKPVPADYDGDGRTDIAVYRPSNGTWYWLRSSDGGFQQAQFGISTDKPQPGDYDGDGQADLGVYRNGVWWILQSSNNAARAVSFGLSTDTPLVAPLN